MSEITVGWLNAAKAFDPSNSETQAEALQSVRELPGRPDVLAIGEFTGPDISDAQLAHLGERFADLGYRFSAITNNTCQPGERNAHTLALLVGQHVVDPEVRTVEYGVRNGFVANINGVTVEAVHGPDDEESKRLATIQAAIGHLAVSASSAPRGRSWTGRPKRSITMADFNGLSPMDHHGAARILRILNWINRHTLLGRVEFDYYKPHPVTRPLGFLLRAIRMADGRSRGELEAVGMRSANTTNQPTCFHLGKLLKLSIDAIYYSGDGEVLNFRQYIPVGQSGRRLSDHNLQVASIRFAD